VSFCSEWLSPYPWLALQTRSGDSAPPLPSSLLAAARALNLGNMDHGGDRELGFAIVAVEVCESAMWTPSALIEAKLS
jgi:hypothetical protein